MGRTIGIDLGTAHSLVATMGDGRPVIIPNAEGHRLTPSIVYFDDQDHTVIGSRAKQGMLVHPDRAASLILHDLGAAKSVTVAGKPYEMEAIAGLILEKLKRDAETYLGEKIDDAVITVPTRLGRVQRAAVRQAGKVAGLNVLRIISATSAAALAYGQDKRKDGQVLIFDLGGGTLDISLLEISDTTGNPELDMMMQVLATNGDKQLGGGTWDQRIVDYVVEQFKGDTGIDLSKDEQAMLRVREASEKAKVELSTVRTTNINLPVISRTADGPIHLDLNLSRAKFEELTRDLVDRCKVPFEKALADANLKPSEIDEIVLVGGSTRMPMIQDLARKLGDGKEPSRGVNPDEVVAFGAAIMAGVLGGEEGTGKKVMLMDVTPLSLGIKMPDGVMTALVEGHTFIPHRKSMDFSTTKDGQTCFRAQVYEGESGIVTESVILGEVQLEGILPAPRGTPLLEVTFDLDANDNLAVNLRDKATGQQTSRALPYPYNAQEDQFFDAISNDHADTVKRLLGQNPRLAHLLNDNGRTALHIASTDGQIEVARHLLFHGASTDAEWRGQTPLQLAVEHNHPELVALLLTTESSANRWFSLDSALLAQCYPNTSVAEILLVHGADVNATDETGNTPLHSAMVLDAGETREYGARWAIRWDDGDYTAMLLAHRADVNAANSDGRTPLSLAAEMGHVYLSALLIASGAKFDVKDGFGATPLHWAAYRGSCEVVRLLLMNGADIHACDAEGRTPLHWAASDTQAHWTMRAHQAEVASTLLSKGAQSDLRDQAGKTALDVANEYGKPAVVRVLAAAAIPDKQNQSKAARATKTKTYRLCSGCRAFQVRTSEQHCPNCGVLRPSASANQPNRPRWWQAFAPAQKSVNAAPQTDLRAVTDTMLKQLRDIAKREVDVRRIEVKAKQESQLPEHLVKSLQSAKIQLARLRRNCLINLDNVDIVRWQTRLEIIASDWNTLTSEGYEKRQVACRAVEDYGQGLLHWNKKWDRGGDRRQLIHRVEQALEACARIKAELLRQQIALTVSDMPEASDTSFFADEYSALLNARLDATMEVAAAVSECENAFNAANGNPGVK